MPATPEYTNGGFAFHLLFVSETTNIRTDSVVESCRPRWEFTPFDGASAVNSQGHPFNSSDPNRAFPELLPRVGQRGRLGSADFDASR